MSHRPNLPVTPLERDPGGDQGSSNGQVGGMGNHRNNSASEVRPAFSVAVRAFLLVKWRIASRVSKEDQEFDGATRIPASKNRHFCQAAAV